MRTHCHTPENKSEKKMKKGVDLPIRLWNNAGMKTITVRVMRPNGTEEIVAFPGTFANGEILRRDFDRAVLLTRSAGRGEILGVVQGTIIEPLSAKQVAEITAQTSGRAIWNQASGLAGIRARNEAREGVDRE